MISAADLITVGGDSSYGLGGYFNTPLEETLPVRMDIQDPQNLPQVSVDFTIDKSGSMARCHGDSTGNQARIESGLPKTDLAKEATYQAIQLLGPSDEVGIVAFDDEAVWIAPTLPLSQQPDIASALAGIQPEGGTNIYAGLSAAVDSLMQARGRVKHIILITDGWSNTGDFDALLEQMAANNITLSIIGAGGGAAEFLEDLAQRGGGRFYAVADPHEIPAVFSERDQTLPAGLHRRRGTFPWHPGRLVRSWRASPPFPTCAATSAPRQRRPPKRCSSPIGPSRSCPSGSMAWAARSPGRRTPRGSGRRIGSDGRNSRGSGPRPCAGHPPHPAVMSRLGWTGTRAGPGSQSIQPIRPAPSATTWRRRSRSSGRTDLARTFNWSRRPQVVTPESLANYRKAPICWG